MGGNMQYNGTDNEYPMYTVKRSLFYYDPEAEPGYRYDPSLDWSTWASWNNTEASQVWRPYNYVTAEVWYGQDAKGDNISEFRDVEFMGERVWLELLKDLEQEGLKEASDSLRVEDITDTA
ncbi:hypothetical protein MBLNU13_g04405t1 [Cladosporium sp. NU13]